MGTLKQIDENTLNFNKNFGVDAGHVGVIDEEYLNEIGGSFKNTHLNKKIVVKPGKYKISFWCEDSWNDEIIENCEIETKGSLIFGDLCYLFSSDTGEDHWMIFLKETDYLRIPNEKFFVVDTGGDGEFYFDIQIEKL